MSTYADGLREAARLCEAEILPPEEVEADRTQAEQVISIRAGAKADRDAFHAAGNALRVQIMEPTMRILAMRFRRLADEADRAGDTSGEETGGKNG